jgi:nucleotide-binding universal stress UspA family protein
MTGDYRILVAIDLKTGTECLLAEAQRYGQAFNATVDILHVAEPDPVFIGYIKASDSEEQDLIDSEREPHAEALRAKHRQTQTYGAALRDKGVRVGRSLMVQGPVLATILEEARKLDYDLLVLGSHHHSALYRFWSGDTATDVAAHPPCALLLVPISN